VAQLQPLLRNTSGLPKDIEPSMYDANIYEIVSMYIEAATTDGVTGDSAKLEQERSKIRDYMANLKGFDGFSGPIHFGADGDAVKNFFIVQGQNGAWSTKATGCSAAGGC
jgi:branched-chain amino acid transport system substrate-binding protein